MRHYLNETFLGHWIGRSGAIEWPPLSPDVGSLENVRQRFEDNLLPCMEVDRQHFQQLLKCGNLFDFRIFLEMH